MYIKLHIHSMHMPLSHILNSGKVWWEESLANLPFSSIWRKVWQISRSAKRLLIVRTNLDDFSLTNHRQFAKFNKHSPAKLSHYTVVGNPNSRSASRK